MRILITLLALFVTACGGGGGGASPQPQSAAQAEVFTVAVYGDSTIVRNDVIATAATLLPKTAGGRPLVLVNEGVRATNAYDLFNGRDGVHPTWEAEMNDSRAQVVTLQHGMNDTYPDQAVFGETLRHLVATAQQYRKTVMLETPNPVVQGPGIRETYDVAALAARVVTIKAVAAEFNIPLCDQDAAIRAAGKATLEWFPDGAHPSEAMSAYKAGVYADCLRKLLHS